MPEFVFTQTNANGLIASDLIGRVGNCCVGIVAGAEANRISVSRSVVSALYIGTPPNSRLVKRGECARAKIVTNEDGLSFRGFYIVWLIGVESNYDLPAADGEIRNR